MSGSREFFSLTRFPLADSGVLLAAETKQKLICELTDALTVDVPKLRFLAASELQMAEIVDESKLWVVFGLACPADSRRHITDSKRSDLRRYFLAEVNDVRKQLATVRGRLLEGLSEARSPFDGREGDESESSTEEIRVSARKRAVAERLFVAGDGAGYQLEIGSLPKTLQRGPLVTITAKVLGISRNIVILGEVKVDSTSALLGDIPAIERIDQMERDPSSPDFQETGTALQLVMDQQRRGCLLVSVALDWASGAPRRFRLSRVL